MEFDIQDDDLARVYHEPDFTGGLQPAIVRAFRMRIQQIIAAQDERLFYELKSLHFEKLKGDRSHQRSMRLNKKFRLILELEEGESGKRVIVVGIEDYH